MHRFFRKIEAALAAAAFAEEGDADAARQVAAEAEEEAEARGGHAGAPATPLRRAHLPRASRA